MAANVESMFSTREKPWHGLGTIVSEAPASKEALELAGLDWKVVQNEDAFAFTDALLGEGVRYETAGSLQSGRRVWMLAKLPNEYIITGEQISPYLVFCNAHDGSSAMKVAMTPVRVVCSNTLNLALETSKRCWSAKHTTNISDKLIEAQEKLLFAERYMSELGKEIHELQKVKMADKKVLEYIDQLRSIWIKYPRMWSLELMNPCAWGVIWRTMWRPGLWKKPERRYGEAMQCMSVTSIPL